MSDIEEAELKERCATVESLRNRCQTILQDSEDLQRKHGFEGLYRYTNSLHAEVGFLDKLLGQPTLIKEEYIQSSNISYLDAVHDAMTELRSIEELMTLKSVPPPDQKEWMPRAELMRNKTVKVDLVAESGLVWIKVIARNAKGLRFDMAGLEFDDSDMFEEEDDDDDEELEEAMGSLHAGNEGFDQLPIFKKAQDYLASAQAHQIHFRTPIVIFAFMRLQETDEFVGRILDHLRSMGIVVYTAGGESNLQTACQVALGEPVPLKSLTTSKLNLDVSTVLAVLSEMAHAPCQPDQVEGEALQIQARREMTSPELPVLKNLLVDKELYMVQSAFNRLENIVKVVGGPREQARFHYLFRNHLSIDQKYDPELWTQLPPLSVHVIPDNTSDRFKQLLEPPSRKGKLNNGRKIRSRFSEFHAIIFGSGDAYRMTTITAIQWMDTALDDAGLTGTAIIAHEPRSLAEQKMKRPSPSS
ncbi:hypothetical protein RO3G_07583 [Lichtheimia corymbifera JMRC:FSU:9682]|uniref:DUF1308 domain-containing protein n=1 Tax=Lichtheimia corymbifera JMRC:FSU:9682 TaxID=1263082 RepID=A0A068SFR1_9FUNG|nr:hypothetical protein RO3G_07583 [Lichtheimia corymbifera JMRC:FSU:9682]